MVQNWRTHLQTRNIFTCKITKTTQLLFSLTIVRWSHCVFNQSICFLQNYVKTYNFTCSFIKRNKFDSDKIACDYARLSLPNERACRTTLFICWIKFFVGTPDLDKRLHPLFHVLGAWDVTSKIVYLISLVSIVVMFSPRLANNLSKAVIMRYYISHLYLDSQFAKFQCNYVLRRPD